jgi:hypothetical protein
MSVYDLKAFRERVTHAARAIMSGYRAGFDGFDATQTRAFDTCFEMYDGDAVVTALIRKAEHDPEFKTALTGYLTPNAEHWQATAAKYARLKDRELPKLSRLLIAKAESVREAEFHALTGPVEEPPDADAHLQPECCAECGEAAPVSLMVVKDKRIVCKPCWGVERTVRAVAPEPVQAQATLFLI